MIVTVIPAFNEQDRIVRVIEDAKKFTDLVIVVDDGSTDATGRRSNDAGARVIRHAENSGAGAATMTGIEAARLRGADIVITLDADGQHDPADIPLLLKPILDDQADIVFANRFGPAPFSEDGITSGEKRGWRVLLPWKRMRGKPRNNIPFIRRIFNSIGNVITLMATNRWVSDSQCGFKVFGPKALKEVDLKMSGFEFCTEIVRESVINRWRIAQIPSKVLYSEYTMAKGQSFGNGIKTALKILLRSFLR